MGLKGAIMSALRGLTKHDGASTEEEEYDDLGRKTGQLGYVALDAPSVFKSVDFFDLWELKGQIKDRVHEYCKEHNVIPADMAAYEVKVGLPASLNFRTPASWYGESKPMIQLLFPTYRAGRVVVSWSRALYLDDKKFPYYVDPNKPVWTTYGTDKNGLILYTTTLPPMALDQNNARSSILPLVIVESPIDAIRVARIGWWAVALGGVHAPAKMRQELARMPQKNMIILLDNDAIGSALDLQEKLQHLRRNVVIAPIMSGDDPASMKKEELRKIFMKSLAELRELNKEVPGNWAVDSHAAGSLSAASAEAMEGASGEAEEAILVEAD